MIPFCIETYGGVGKEGTQLLQTLAALSKEYSPAAFLLHARKRLSVTLQSSNANIQQLAIQQFHLHNNARNKSTYEAHLVKKASIGYAQPIDADRLEHAIQPALQAQSAAIIEEQQQQLQQRSSNKPNFIHPDRVGQVDCIPAA